MWTMIPLALALSLAPGQGGKLELDLTNVRVTYGLLGAVRSEDTFLPGDLYLVAFDIENIKVDPEGKIVYSMGMEVFTKEKGKEKSVYKQDPRKLEAYSSLGGNRLPAFAHVEIGLDQPEGDYTLKVDVKDEAAGTSKSLTSKFTVAKKDFGLVRLNTTYDGEGKFPAPPGGVVGQSLWVNFLAVGFKRDDNKQKQPNVHVEMVVKDDKGKETVEKPFSGEVTEMVPATRTDLPMQFLLTLNRPGKYTVTLRAEDRVAKKKAELKFPIVVVEPK
jgi:hypothetical protein